MSWEIVKREKDPSSEEYFGFTWGTKYLGSDTISASTWILESGLNQLAVSQTNTETKIKLSGGVVGGGTIKTDINYGVNIPTYRITNEVTLSNSGEKIRRSIDIFIKAH